MTKIGILALQGSVREHIAAVKRCGGEALPIKSVAELENIDGLILPGGESTTMRCLLDAYGFMKPLRRFSSSDHPIFGTCAGLILLAKNIVDQPDHHIGLMDITVERNLYDRQINSFEATLNIKDIGRGFPGVFIRAPHLSRIGEGVEVLCEHDGRIVMARQENLLACSFHPELTEDTRITSYFVKMVRESIARRRVLQSEVKAAMPGQ